MVIMEKPFVQQSMFRPPRSIAIAIASRNRQDDIVACIRSILARPSAPDEIIVIDQSTPRYVLPNLPNLRHVYAPHLSGLTAARNRAIAEATSDVVLFLDDDVLLLTDCVAELLNAFSRRPDAAGLQCQVEMPYTPSRISRLMAAVFEHGFFNASPVLKPTGVQLRRVWGCAMAFRKDVLRAEAFDEHLVGYGLGEDWEYSIRARRHGMLWLAPGAKVAHNKTALNRFQFNRMLRDRWTNFQYFYEKHEARRSPMNRFWRAWWMLGESLKWSRVNMGFPALGWLPESTAVVEAPWRVGGG
ncbi:MAG: glycosyltransferase [Candidatus Eremiobacteraeota bacterium]|nr:glycosyltransferase [Candidatus Eremiobacteraeota bacterium]